MCFLLLVCCGKRTQKSRRFIVPPFLLLYFGTCMGGKKSSKTKVTFTTPATRSSPEISETGKAMILPCDTQYNTPPSNEFQSRFSLQHQSGCARVHPTKIVVLRRGCRRGLSIDAIARRLRYLRMSRKPASKFRPWGCVMLSPWCDKVCRVSAIYELLSMYYQVDGW